METSTNATITRSYVAMMLMLRMTDMGVLPIFRSQGQLMFSAQQDQLQKGDAFVCTSVVSPDRSDVQYQ